MFALWLLVLIILSGIVFYFYNRYARRRSKN
jgi:hypothetical protein